ncbi:EspF repeat-containing protein [Nocardiopsis trehalosi]|uniref:EspF repeat-containing protein n=1 Tax=Nocardiopsis trehalosi TaxID=109329 RepID=UPI00082C44C2|nr:EspF repeat-containing protein [Nocardiopsis trehalosi]
MALTPDPYAPTWSSPSPPEENAQSIPLSADDIALVDRLADAVERWSDLNPGVYRRIMALSRSLHMRAGAAGRGHHVPMSEAELRAIEAAMEVARKGAFGRDRERLVVDVRAAVRRWYQRVGAARVLTIRGIAMYATDPE